MDKPGTIQATIRWSGEDEGAWTEFFTLTKDELLDLGLILKRMKDAGALRDFSLVHVHVRGIGLSETLASLPPCLKTYIPPPLA